MYAEAKGDHLKRVLLSSGLAPSVKYVSTKVEVTQVRFGGAQGLEVREHVAQLRTNSLNIVTFFKPSSIITGDLAPQDRVGSELSEAYMVERILAQWEAPSWRPAVCRKISYVGGGFWVR
jgi:hypothetical protein